MFDYIDIHSHLYFPDFDADREAVIAQMKKEKIATITIGTDFSSSEMAVKMAETHDNLFACIGQHPGDVTPESVFDERLTILAQHKKVVAIGECGLDYFRMNPDNLTLKEIQKNVFLAHIKLSLQSEKPLMLHIRTRKGTQDAYEDTLDILETYMKSGEKLRGNVHFFAGDMTVLMRFLALGFSISFTGVLTFTHDYDELVRETPINMIMSETDSPFVAPVPFRGGRNSPLFVPHIAEAIAQIKGLKIEEIRQILVENATRHFALAGVIA